MSNPTKVIVIDGSLTRIHFCAHLIYNPEERIGKGTFKTANLATLEFDSVRPFEDLGSPSNGLTVNKFPVALKQGGTGIGKIYTGSIFLLRPFQVD